ncbi:MAG: tetratricopeptide repeat protein [Planctomycetota bacterium]|nr:tetratricopeptide repeat protein [Planctomycetota bacterium]
MRKEPVVFLLFAAFAGWSMKDMLSDSGSRSRSSKPKAKEYVSLQAPDVDLALADLSRSVALDRDLFSPPSPTSSLPPLEVALPPLEPLTALAPPTGWGPSPSRYGEFLRRDESPAGAAMVPGLFDSLAGGGRASEGDGGGSAVALAAELSDDPEARAAQIAGLKKEYDWIYTNKFEFGRILNENRYLLPDLDDPQLVFLPVNPATGSPLYRSPITYEPGRVDEFGLVDNALTEVEVALGRFGDPLQPGEFESALQFADSCLLKRNETPRALEVGETLYRRAQQINLQDDARPRLGLATCFQLGFRFEDAYDTYRELLENGHEANASIHARLGVLLGQLRMKDAAEASFKEGLRVERTNWEARYWYGRFLVKEGRVDEALDHLQEAVRREPKAPEERAMRVRIRLAYAGALLGAGQMDESVAAFGTALSADVADEVGLQAVAAAGTLSAMRFTDDASSLMGDEIGGGAPVEGGFDVLLAAGLYAMDAGQPELAAQTLGLALEADPFRRFEALRAMSRLAEITGNPEEAVTYADEALRAAPGDPWTLYQRGRLYELDGDDFEARAAYRAALDVELDLVPALERMGALLQTSGDFAGAERYYDRALTVEGGSAALWSRRGWNALQAGDLSRAEICFGEARRLSPSLASARAGVAWWQYASGNSAEAITLFSEIVDDRRASGEGDAFTAYATSQGDRIVDHESKEVWLDRFDRAPGRVGNGWVLDQGFGPLVDIRDEGIGIDGQNDRGGRTRAFRSLPPDRFLAFSCVLTVGEKAKGTRAGVFISSERTRPGGESQVTAEVVISRNREGQLEARVQKSPTYEEARFKQVVGPEWPIGQPIRVEIERVGDDLDATFTIYIDGEPVATNVECDRLTSSRQPINFGAFVGGEAGRRADLFMDDVRVVRRR